MSFKTSMGRRPQFNFEFIAATTFDGNWAKLHVMRNSSLKWVSREKNDKKGEPWQLERESLHQIRRRWKRINDEMARESKR